MNNRETLLKQRAKLVAQLERTSAQLDGAEEKLAQAQDDYRATPEGLARSLRSIERAALTPGTPAAEVHRLTKAHVAAEAAARDEYKDRTSRWGHRDGDGPLFACPMSGTPALQRLLITSDILGVYRVDPTRDDGAPFTVRVFRPAEPKAIRTQFAVPAELRTSEGVSLAAVLKNAFTATNGRRKLARFLGSHLYSQIGEALGVDLRE